MLQGVDFTLPDTTCASSLQFTNPEHKHHMATISKKRACSYSAVYGKDRHIKLYTHTMSINSDTAHDLRVSWNSLNELLLSRTGCGICYHCIRDAFALPLSLAAVLAKLEVIKDD